MSSVWTTLTPEARRERARHAALYYALDDLSSLLQTYLEIKGASTTTRNNYRSRLKGIVDYLNSHSINILNPPFGLGGQYLIDQVQMGISYESVRANATTMRSLYEALCWAQVIQIDPFLTIDISATLKSLKMPHTF